jgi:hypothetical protein
VATPAELLAELHAQRDGGRGVSAVSRQPQIKIGKDLLQLDITLPKNGHLYIALAGSDGKSLYLLYPIDLAKDNAVKAGQKVSLPSKGWEIAAGGPAGTETLLVMVTDAPRELSGLALAAAVGAVERHAGRGLRHGWQAALLGCVRRRAGESADGELRRLRAPG